MGVPLLFFPLLIWVAMNRRQTGSIPIASPATVTARRGHFQSHLTDLLSDPVDSHRAPCTNKLLISWINVATIQATG